MNKPAKITSLASALLLTFALTACGGLDAPAPGSESEDYQELPTAPKPDENAQPGSEEAISETGEYNGQGDPHTIEVDVNGTPTSFQLAEGVSSQLEGLNEGDTIFFEYVQRTIEGSEVPQLEILSLKKAETAGADGGGNSEEETAAERPATETFEMTSEGMPDRRTAELQQGDGYSLYVFDAYTFDAAENKLYLTAYPDYYAQIEKLPSDFNLDELRIEGQKELEEYGEAREYADDQLAEGPMYGARMLLQVSGENGLHDYVVWEPEGENGYVFRLHAPSGEASETFPTPALTSLASIQADSAATGN